MTAALLCTLLTLSLAERLPAPAAAPATAHVAADLHLPVVAGPPTAEVRAAFTYAISRVYRAAMCLVFCGWLATFFVPELPLRTAVCAPPILVAKGHK